jgi:hypothetical protein
VTNRLECDEERDGKSFSNLEKRTQGRSKYIYREIATELEEENEAHDTIATDTCGRDTDSRRGQWVSAPCGGTGLTED